MSRILLVWLSVTLALLVVLLTSWPVLVHPQLEPDDYRYLDIVQSIREDLGTGIFEASIVENRWDHLWWIGTNEKVRFFRPIVVLSYWLDVEMYGPAIERGLLITNVMLHATCVLLVCFLMHCWLGRGVPALLATVAFAALFCHGEVIWYAAGRTDTLAASGFLGALALHVGASGRGRLRWLALPCFAFALFSKELAIALPIVCFLHDWWIERHDRALALLRRDWMLYAGYLAVAAAYVATRGVALSGGDSGMVFPYFVSPLEDGFLSHVWVQFRTYGENLLITRGTPPFLQPADLPLASSTAGLVLSVVSFAGVIALLFRDRRLWLLFALAFTTWLPTAFVYVSERYLYLPSVAFVGILGLMAQKCTERGRIGFAFLLLCCAWIGFQGWELRAENQRIMLSPRPPHAINQQLARLDPGMPRGADVLLLNLPGDWVHAQFTEAQWRVRLKDPTLRVRVLTTMPWDGVMGAGMRLERLGPRVFEVRGGRGAAHSKPFPVMMKERVPFPWASFETGQRYADPRLGFEVEIVEGEASQCHTVRFTLPKDLEAYHIWAWSPLLDPALPLHHRRVRGQLHALTLGRLPD